MVAYSFKRRFVEPIRVGLGMKPEALAPARAFQAGDDYSIFEPPAPKRQTIRADRRRHARPGEELQLYCGMRTKGCFLIGRSRCIEVKPIYIEIEAPLIIVGEGKQRRRITTKSELDEFARTDGFEILPGVRDILVRGAPRSDERLPRRSHQMGAAGSGEGGRMNQDSRELCMMNHEGQTLQMAGAQGKEHAVEIAHCVVDGVMNALIKIEGPEAAAQFAFALSDRVVGRVRLPSLGDRLPEPEKVPEPPARADAPSDTRLDVVLGARLPRRLRRRRDRRAVREASVKPIGDLPLFSYPRSPGFKEGTTSRDAAVAMTSRASILRNRAFAEIVRAGKMGLTADQVAERTRRDRAGHPAEGERTRQGNAADDRPHRGEAEERVGPRRESLEGSVKAATLFSGIGAPEVAMPNWTWLWHAEIEKFPCAVMKARHPESVNLGDVNAEDFVERALAAGRPDVVVWGAPCQDFSIAGKRVGMDGARGNLALVGLGIIGRLRPGWMVFENVPGLLSSYSGSAEAERALRDRAERGRADFGAGVDGEEDSDFAAFLSAVRELGYTGCYRIFDAQFAGVPQRRRRIFFVGHLGEDWRCGAAVLLDAACLRGDSPPSREAGQRAAGTVTARVGNGSRQAGANGNLAGQTELLPQSSKVYDEEGVAPTVQATGKRNGNRAPQVIAGTLNANKKAAGSATQQDAENGLLIAPPLNAGMGRRRGSGAHGDAMAFGGNNTSGELEVSTAVRAKGGTGHGDFESETFVMQTRGSNVGVEDDQTGTLGSNANRASGGAPMVMAFELRERGDDGRGYDRAPNFSENVSPAVNTVKTPVIAFDTTQITYPENRSKPDDRSPQLSQSGHPSAIAFDCKAGGDTSFSVSELTPSPDAEGRVRLRDPGLGIGDEGDPMFSLTAAKPHAVAFTTKESGADASVEVAPTLRAESGDPHMGGRMAVAFKPSHYTRDKDSGPSDVMAPLTADADKGDQDPVLFTGAAVRRLTPVECARLQAFPDNYLDIKFRGKPAADGPKYRALGNSMCVAEIRWILQRIEMFEGLKK